MADNYTKATVTPYLPASLFTDIELETLANECGLFHQRYDDQLYFFAEEHFCEIGITEIGQPYNCTAILQDKLKLLDPAEYPHIIIEGAATCSKMRQGEFGGFAFFITREEIRWVSTWSWIGEQQAVAETREPR